MRYGARRVLLATCAWTVLGVFALVLTSAPAVAYDGDCATSTLEERFVLPDGSQHAAGKITLCRSQSTPSVAMYVGYVDRAPIGLFYSHRGRAEAPTQTEPYMMFARDQQGLLHLYGLALPISSGMETFLFAEFPGRRAV